jgi:hypothetical protein
MGRMMPPVQLRASSENGDHHNQQQPDDPDRDGSMGSSRLAGNPAGSARREWSVGWYGDWPGEAAGGFVEEYRHVGVPG